MALEKERRVRQAALFPLDILMTALGRSSLFDPVVSHDSNLT
jgi:hypothetical protein